MDQRWCAMMNDMVLDIHLINVKGVRLSLTPIFQIQNSTHDGITIAYIVVVHYKNEVRSKTL